MATRKRKFRRDWEDVAEEAQEHRDASIREQGITLILDRIQSLGTAPRCSTDIPSKVLETKDRQITECLPEELLRMLATGDVRAVDVTRAFLRRAAIAQKFVSSHS